MPPIVHGTILFPGVRPRLPSGTVRFTVCEFFMADTPTPPAASISRSGPSRDLLETFENRFPGRDFLIEIVAPEFTSLCPKTGQPDFGSLTLRYVPDRLCVELKSFKMYLQAFRNEGIFYEHVTNRILDDLVAAITPRRMTLLACFTPRGGIRSRIVVSHPAGEHLPPHD
jgi:7-cyano-7-deazaguanine reductase